MPLQKLNNPTQSQGDQGDCESQSYHVPKQERTRNSW